MKRSTRNAERSKQEIIEKAAPVFNRFGYAGTKMQMIIDATGFQMGGVYRHFNTKNDLAKAAFQYNFEVLKSNYLKGIDDSLSPREQLLKLMDNFRNTIISPNVKGGCPILNTATEVDDTDESFRKLTLSALNEIIKIQKDILEAGKKAGEFQANIQAQKEAQYIMATIQGAIMIAQLKKNAQVLIDINERLATYIKEEIFVTF